jgi:hypothetical protein
MGKGILKIYHKKGEYLFDNILDLGNNWTAG